MPAMPDGLPDRERPRQPSARRPTKTRIAFLDRAVADKAPVGGYHLPFPGFGHVVREGSGYRWLPADWRWTT